MREKFYPKEENLGKDCMFWGYGNMLMMCAFPKVELEGRRSCEGIIDDVCLFVKDGRPAPSLTQEQAVEIKTRMPDFGDKSYLPPGDVQK